MGMKLTVPTVLRSYLKRLVMAMPACCLLSQTSTAQTDESLPPLTPACRLHFTMDWEDNDTEPGTLPQSRFSKEIQGVFQSVGVHLEPEPITPWPRAIEQVMRGQSHGLAVALKTPERAEVMHFLGPVFLTPWAAYRHKETQISSTERPKIGVFDTYAHLAPIQEAVADIGGDIVSLSPERLGRMLAAGRIDMLYAPNLEERDIQELVKQPLETISDLGFDVRIYVALRKDAPCAGQRERLDAAIDAWSTTDIAQAYGIAPITSRTFGEVMTFFEESRKNR